MGNHETYKTDAPCYGLDTVSKLKCDIVCCTQKSIQSNTADQEINEDVSSGLVTCNFLSQRTENDGPFGMNTNLNSPNDGIFVLRKVFGISEDLTESVEPKPISLSWHFFVLFDILCSVRYRVSNHQLAHQGVWYNKLKVSHIYGLSWCISAPV